MNEKKDKPNTKTTKTKSKTKSKSKTAKTKKKKSALRKVKKRAKRFIGDQCPATNLYRPNARRPKDPNQPMPKFTRMMLGGAAGVSAQSIVQPIDFIKIRMQVSTGPNVSTLGVLRGIMNQEGSKALYNGMSAGLLRQAGYTTTRMGIYGTLLEAFTIDGRPPSLITRAVLQMISSISGAVVGTPADVALVRMAADGNLPSSKRKRYKHVIDALYRVAQEEGKLAYWRGVVPTMCRASVVSGGRMLVYTLSRDFFKRNGVKEGIKLDASAATVSSIVTTSLALPFDITKTRLQNMRVTQGEPEYKGMFDVMIKTTRREGYFALWKGFTPCFFRKGLHTIFFFIFLEQFIKIYKDKCAEKEVK